MLSLTKTFNGGKKFSKSHLHLETTDPMAFNSSSWNEKTKEKLF